MRSICIVFATLAVFVMIGTGVRAGTNKFETGYPKEGTENGTIVVKGKASADTGWTLNSIGHVVYWPVGGGNAQEIQVTVGTGGENTGKWEWDVGKKQWIEGSITGLVQGGEYWVYCAIWQTNGTMSYPIYTDPVKVKAK